MKQHLLKNTYAAIVALFIAMMALPTTAQAQTKYDLKICGTQVTSDNCGDLSVIAGVEGTVKYDPDSKILTLEGAKLNIEGEADCIDSDIDGLTIKVSGTNELKVGDWTAITVYAPTTITGGGTLNVKSEEYTAIYAPSKNLTIRNCIVNAKGKYGISGGSKGKLRISKATVTAEGRMGSICNFKKITLEDCAITRPAGAVVDKGAIRLNGEKVASEVRIEPIVTMYDLIIAGHRVTSVNCYDLTVIPGVSGRASYDPDNKTLTLEGAKLNAEGDNFCFWSKIDGLTIKVSGTNELNAELSAAVKVYAPATITGGGTLNAESRSGCGIYAGETNLTIKDCIVNAKGTWGITGQVGSKGKLLIRKATVTAEGRYGSICDFKEITLEDCAITQPAGAVVDNSQGAVVLNGEKVTSEVKIEPITKYDLKICGTQVTSGNCGDLSVIDGVEGTVKYDPDNKTLTLEGAKLNVEDISGILSKIDGLTIKVSDTNELNATNSTIVVYAPTTITGGGTLNVKSEESCGIYVWSTNLTIKDCIVNVKGVYGIVGWSGSNEKLLISKATVTAEGRAGSIYDFKEITLEDCAITQPAGAVVDNSQGAVVLNGEKVTGEVKIEPITKYDLIIAGYRVTSANCYDLTVIPGVSGRASYDPDNRILTLENAIIIPEESYLGLEAGISMTVKVIGTNSITCRHYYQPTFMSKRRMTITGGGTLNVTSQKASAINAYESDLIIENCTVNAKGAQKGITGYDGTNNELHIRNATVTAEGTAEGAIYGLAALHLTDCDITEPKHTYFSRNGVRRQGALVKKVVISPVTEYALRIAGKKVHSANCGDLTEFDGVKGTVKYDPDSKTLTLKDATIIAVGETGINSSIDGLTIKVMGTNKLSSKYIGISVGKPTTITGTGTFDLEISGGMAIFMPTHLTIDGCKMGIKGGKFGILGFERVEDKLTIRNATVTVEGTEHGSIVFLGALNLEGCAITRPAGAVFDDSKHAVVLDGEIVTSEVKIEPVVTKYALYICGTQVTSGNCGDLSVIDGVEGAVSYNFSTKTLTLDNATIKNSSMYAAIDVDRPMDIEVKGVCKIKSDAPGIYLREPTRIYSERSTFDDQCLEVESSSEVTICMNKTPLIIDNCNVSAKNTYSKGMAISGEWADYESTLTIKGDYTRVTAEGKGGSICSIVKLTLDGCAVTQPKGAAFDASLQGVALNGELVKSKVVIEKTPTAIEHVTTDALATKQGIYTLSGVKLDGEVKDLPKGIYIVNGKKFVKK